MKRLIVTGDDFGLAVPLNEAVIRAHVAGILTTASLMVAAEGASDAIERARATPGLRVGLHVTLVRGRSVLPPQEIPDLVDQNGEFLTHLVRAGFCFARPAARWQLEQEVRAQFECFRRTGLALDHVNAHNHMQLHPAVLQVLLKVGREFGMRALRFPYEPPLHSWRASRRSLADKTAWLLFLSPWLALLRARLRRAGLRYNDFLFGMGDSGSMSKALIRALIRRLPEGVTEMYFHPAVGSCPELHRRLPGYDHQGEFRALTSPEVRRALEEAGVTRISFSDI